MLIVEELGPDHTSLQRSAERPEELQIFPQSSVEGKRMRQNGSEMATLKRGPIAERDRPNSVWTLLLAG